MVQLNILFTINDSKITQESNRTHFIFKTVSTQTTDKFKKPFECSLTTNINCQIYLLGDESDLGKGPTSWTDINNGDQIQTNKYYLMFLNSDVGEITNVKIKTSSNSYNTYNLTPMISFTIGRQHNNNHNIILS